jgi:hypothetical protein
MANTTGAEPGDCCTCPMSLRERGQHSIACPERRANQLKAGAVRFAQRWNAERRAAREVRHG